MTEKLLLFPTLMKEIKKETICEKHDDEIWKNKKIVLKQ